MCRLLNSKEKKKYLYSICVHPDFRSKSIGEYLLQIFLTTEPLLPCYLTVYKSAKLAVNLYEKFGFKKTKIVESIISNDIKLGCK
ncbi:MAG: GNAT family N-acetyltransferase [Candidatus Cloacimonetes bacterium]|nr:GNAT family N-acetyltransferase [Candidatus Cloacimonadota bacterium]MBL7085648.1 GNAT family N-acetyltransferase [Candidatus Cloacimonadota bacterium]